MVSACKQQLEPFKSVLRYSTYRTSPGEPDLPSRDEDGGQTHNRDHGLRWRAASIRVILVTVDPLADERFANDCDHATETYSAEGQSRKAWRPSS